MTTETVFLDTQEVKVTNTRLVVKGKTYALGGVTSFRKQSKELPQTSKAMLWVLLVLVSFFLLIAVASFAGTPTSAAGFITLILAVVLFLVWRRIKNYTKKYLHTLLLSVASGEVAAYETHNGAYATDIEAALTNAVIHRG